MNLKAFLILLKDAARCWKDDRALDLGAALAFYAIFSIGPLLLVVISLLGIFLGEPAMQGQVIDYAETLIGERGARALSAIVDNTRDVQFGIAGAAIGGSLLLLGATAIFVHLRYALNKIWGITPMKRHGAKGFLKGRILPLFMIAGVGLIMLLAFLFRVLISVSSFTIDVVPGGMFTVKLTDLMLSIILLSMFFVLVYKFLPDAKIEWDDVWVGAIGTSVIFTIGRELVTFYLGISNVISVYGAAGSFIVILIWIFFSSQVLLYGAEFTQAYANRYGSKVKSKNK